MMRIEPRNIISKIQRSQVRFNRRSFSFAGVIKRSNNNNYFKVIYRSLVFIIIQTKGSDDMYANIESSNLVLLICLSLISIITCVTQIILKNKVQFLEICKISAFLPFLAIIIKGLHVFSMAYWAMSEANDIPPKIWDQSISRILSALSLAVYLTIFLLIVYAITNVIIINKAKNE
jgi:hypothetical protein